jgi:hypothetical protein
MNITNQTTKKIEEQPFEFLLYINDHIICQRYFPIREYNADVIKSYEMKDLMDNICGINIDNIGRMGIIPSHLKKKSINYLWENYNPYYMQQEDPNKTEKIDNFQFEIKVNKVSVAKGQFSGNLFPPKVRYAVDIKEIIPSIMAEIREYFTLKEYNMVAKTTSWYDIYNN